MSERNIDLGEFEDDEYNFRDENLRDSVIIYDEEKKRVICVNINDLLKASLFWLIDKGEFNGYIFMEYFGCFIDISFFSIFSKGYKTVLLGNPWYVPYGKKGNDVIEMKMRKFEYLKGVEELIDGKWLFFPSPLRSEKKLPSVEFYNNKNVIKCIYFNPSIHFLRDGHFSFLELYPCKTPKKKVWSSINFNKEKEGKEEFYKIQTFYPDGQLKSLYNFKNGRLDSMETGVAVIKYYHDGKKKEEWFHTNGILHSDNPNIPSVIRYDVNGKKTCEYYFNNEKQEPPSFLSWFFT